MSTYAGYHIDLPLRSDAAQDADWYLERPEFQYNGPMGRGRNPGFGAAFHYVGRDYSSIAGVAVENGRLKVGGWAQNMHRDFEGTDRSRLEVFLAFLADSTDARPGTIVGCIWPEHYRDDHADPLVVCADGRIRQVSTTPVPYYDGMLGNVAPDPSTLIPIENVLPVEAIVVEEDHSSLYQKDLLNALSSVETPRSGMR